MLYIWVKTCNCKKIKPRLLLFHFGKFSLPILGKSNIITTMTDTDLPNTTPPIIQQTDTPLPEYHTPPKHLQIFSLIGALVLLVGMGAVILSMKNTQDTRSRATLTGPTLALSPATKTGGVGTTFSVGMTINSNTDTVAAAELRLTYDPTAIQIVSFTPGTTLPVVLVPETHANGAIAVTLGVQPTTPFKGAGIVGTWTVKILAAKQSSITVTSATQVAAIGKTTNALVSATGMVITGSSNSVTSTPTPTHVPGATNTPTSSPTVTPTRIPGATNTLTPTPTPVIENPLSSGQAVDDYSPFSDTVPQPEIPKTSIFQQIFSAILQFFLGLFQK